MTARALLAALLAAGRPLGSAELASQTAMGAEEVLGAVRKLQGLGLPVEGGPKTGWILRREARLAPVSFTAEEAGALVAALSTMDGSPEWRAAASRGVTRLAEAWPEVLPFKGPPAPLRAWGHPAEPGLPEPLAARAVAEGLCLAVALEGEETVLRPLALCGETLTAWCEGTSTLRELSLAEVRASALTGRSFDGAELRKALGLTVPDSTAP
ncbi:hypothetical protein [Pseudoroseicyclus sp. CXY001]|uniref:hypothetical protein n=1 Tax=Pseudoroseicyclus sp. CXY001 TaxID=3242492 RepID=UPI003571385D